MSVGLGDFVSQGRAATFGLLLSDEKSSLLASLSDESVFFTVGLVSQGFGETGAAGLVSQGLGDTGAAGFESHGFGEEAGAAGLESSQGRARHTQYDSG